MGLAKPGRRVGTEEEGSREATTVRPPFDPETFARESDSNMRVLEESGRAPAERPRDHGAGVFSRPTVPPPPGVPSYAAIIGVEGIPELVVAREDLEWFDLSPEARTLLQHVDGENAVAVICDKVHLPENDVISELERLAGEGLVSWR